MEVVRIWFPKCYALASNESFRNQFVAAKIYGVVDRFPETPYNERRLACIGSMHKQLPGAAFRFSKSPAPYL